MHTGILAVILVAHIVVGAAAQVRAQEATPSAESLFAGLGLPEITLTATDDGLELSQAEVPAGHYLFTLHNESWDPDLRVTIVGFVLGNKPIESLCREEFPPECYYWAPEAFVPGGVSARSPRAILELRGGAYGLWGPGEVSATPAATLAVSGDPGAPVAGTGPEATTITVVPNAGGAGLALHVEGKLKPGPQLVRVANGADQLLIVSAAQHRAPLTLDIDAHRRSTPTPSALDPEQRRPVAIIGPQSPGTQQWVAMDLVPGRLYLACSVRDPVATGDARGWYEATATVLQVTEA